MNTFEKNKNERILSARKYALKDMKEKSVKLEKQIEEQEFESETGIPREQFDGLYKKIVHAPIWITKDKEDDLEKYGSSAVKTSHHFDRTLVHKKTNIQMALKKLDIQGDKNERVSEKAYRGVEAVSERVDSLKTWVVLLAILSVASIGLNILTIIQ